MVLSSANSVTTSPRISVRSKQVSAYPMFSVSTLKIQAHQLIQFIFETETDRLKRVINHSAQSEKMKYRKLAESHPRHNFVPVRESRDSKSAYSQRRSSLTMRDEEQLCLVDSSLNELQNLLDELKFRNELDLILLVRASQCLATDEDRQSKRINAEVALRRAKFLLFISEEFQTFQQDRSKIKDFHS